MEFKFLHILAFLSVAIVASHATLPSVEYWNSVLPNTPMPQAVKDVLQPSSEWLENESTNVGVGGHGVNVNTGKGNVNVGKDGVRVNTGKSNVNVGKGGVRVNTGKSNVNVGNGGGVRVNTGKHGGTRVGVGKGGVTVGTHPRKGKPVYVRVGDPFAYAYAATETQLHDNPNVALFFLEKDLHSGKKMNLQFSKTTKDATFLPRQVADLVPFSSNKLPEIIDKFSVNPSSDEAKAMRKTIKECEEAPIRGEEKLCATSLESMVDFSTSKLGKEVKAISTKAEDGERREYHIVGVKKLPSEKPVVACHRQEYAYAVFYCHKTDTTVAYEVEMVANSGSKVAAVAVCHKDTAAWNPRHLAFQVLKVKPGAVPVCHFLPEDHIVWISKN